MILIFQKPNKLDSSNPITGYTHDSNVIDPYYYLVIVIIIATNWLVNITSMIDSIDIHETKDTRKNIIMSKNVENIFHGE